MFPVVVTPSSLEFSCPSFVFCNSYFSFCNHIFGSVVIVFLTKFAFVPFLYSFISLIYSHFLPLNSPCLEFSYIIDIWFNSEWFRTRWCYLELITFNVCVCCPSISGNVRTIRSNSVKYCSHYHHYLSKERVTTQFALMYSTTGIWYMSLRGQLSCVSHFLARLIVPTYCIL